MPLSLTIDESEHVVQHEVATSLLERLQVEDLGETKSVSSVNLELSSHVYEYSVARRWLWVQSVDLVDNLLEGERLKVGQRPSDCESPSTFNLFTMLATPWNLSPSKVSID